MNRTGQFSVEPSQYDNQQNSFYTEGNSKTISKNTQEAQILYDLNDASSKTMDRRNPPGLIPKGSHNIISASNGTNEDEQEETQDRVGSALLQQSDLKKNFGIKSNIHIHLQTKDNTMTATNSETRDNDAYKQFRDSTQKNADALYESNNEEEESKDVVVTQIPMDDQLAKLDRKRKSNEPEHLRQASSNLRSSLRPEDL